MRVWRVALVQRRSPAPCLLKLECFVLPLLLLPPLGAAQQSCPARVALVQGRQRWLLEPRSKRHIMVKHLQKEVPGQNLPIGLWAKP